MVFLILCFKFQNKNQKILGICLGMQLLFESSTEEGNTKGLGILKGKVEKFSFSKVKISKFHTLDLIRYFFIKK